MPFNRQSKPESAHKQHTKNSTILLLLPAQQILPPTVSASVTGLNRKGSPDKLVFPELPEMFPINNIIFKWLNRKVSQGGKTYHVSNSGILKKLLTV